MKKSLLSIFILAFSMGLVACATKGYISKGILKPYPLDNIPSSYAEIYIMNFTPEQIEFKLRFLFPHAFVEDIESEPMIPSKPHLLDRIPGGDSAPVIIISDSEGRVISEKQWASYMGIAPIIKMRTREGFEFRTGKEYIFGICTKSAFSYPIFGNFRPIYSYKFVLPEKKPVNSSGSKKARLV